MCLIDFIAYSMYLTKPKCRLTYRNLSRHMATCKSSEQEADPMLLCFVWSPRPTDRLLTTFIPPGSSDQKLQGFPSTYFEYWNMYLEISITFQPKLQLKNFLNPQLGLIQDKKLLESCRVSVIIQRLRCCHMYKCTQTIVKKYNCTTAITLTEA
jgi:hypothetical protein